MLQSKIEENKTTLKRVSLTLFFCLFCHFAFAAASTTTIKGLVSDAKTKRAIPKASVSVYSGSKKLASRSTNSSGNYILTFNNSKNLTVQVKVSATGYQPKTKKQRIAPKKTYALHFSLIPKDKTPPTGSIKINNNTQYANSAAVVLTLSAADNSGGSGLSQMQLSNNNVNWSNPENYASGKSWNLPSGDGIKTIYVKFKDKEGNWSGAYSDTIILDTTPPSSPLVTDDGSITTSADQLHAIWISQDATSGITEYQYKITQDSIDGLIIMDWDSSGTNEEATRSGLSLTQDKIYYFSAKAKNGAGLWSEIGYSNGIKVVDESALSINVNEGEISIGSQSVDSTVISLNPITVINNSSELTQTYSLSLVNPEGWTVSQTGAGQDTYVLNAAFDADGIGIDWSNDNHALSTTAAACTATRFAGDQTGVDVPYNDTRKLWFQFKAPTSTTALTEQKITIVITAQGGS